MKAAILTLALALSLQGCAEIIGGIGQGIFEGYGTGDEWIKMTELPTKG